MAQAEKPSTTRRALVSALALTAIPMTAGAAADVELATLKARYDDVHHAIEAAEDQGRIDALCDEQGEIADAMTRLPTLTKAGARAKAEVLASYFEPTMDSHVDGRLFDQVLGWLKTP